MRDSSNMRTGNHSKGDGRAKCNIAWERRSLTRAGARSNLRKCLIFGFLLDLDIQPLDLLIQRGERNAELLGGVGLVPVAALQLINDDAANDVFEDVEERCVGIVLEQRVLEAAAGYVAGQKVGADERTRRQHHAALDAVL